MSTIQQLHNLVSVNETQQGTSDRITGAEVRAVDNAVIDELPRRGIVQAVGTDDLATIPKSESTNANIFDNGIYSLYQTVAAPDNVTTFPAADPGYVWKKIASLTTQQNIRAAITSDNGILYDPSTGIFSLGEVNQPYVSPPTSLQGKLTADRSIQLNGHSLFFTDTAKPMFLYLGGGGNAMLGMDTSGIVSGNKLNIYTYGERQFAAGAQIYPWAHNFRLVFQNNGNVTMRTAENEHSNTWIQSEFNSVPGYLGGTISIPSNSFNALMVETAFAGSWAGGWTGIVSDISTRAKFTGLGGVAGDKFYHIIINAESQSRINTTLNEHGGLIIYPLTLPNGSVTTTTAINQMGPTDKNLFAGPASFSSGITAIGPNGDLTNMPQIKLQFTGDPKYPMTLYSYIHDNLGIAMDAYFSGGTWLSGSSQGSFLLNKSANHIGFFGGVSTVGAPVTMQDLWNIRPNGDVYHNIGQYLCITGGISVGGNVLNVYGLNFSYDAGAELASITSYRNGANHDFRLICTNAHLYGGGGANGENLALNTDGSVSCGGSPAFPSAQFQIYSTTKGFLPPKMTTAQRNAIVTPTGGLMVYDTDANKISVYNGTTWKYLLYE